MKGITFEMIMITVIQMICYWYWCWLWWWYVPDDMLLMIGSNDFKPISDRYCLRKCSRIVWVGPLLRRHFMISKLRVVYRWMGSWGELMRWLIIVELLQTVCDYDFEVSEILKRLDNMWLRTTVTLLRITSQMTTGDWRLTDLYSLS